MAEDQEEKKDTQPEDEINIRSDDVQEIISHIPHWLVRSGISLIFSIFTAVLIMSWFIQYPDTIKTSVIITTDPPPEKHVTRTTGNIQFLIKNGDTITEGTSLAYIKSAAELADIFYAEKIAKKFSTIIELQEDTLKKHIQNINQLLQLGDLQSDYSAFTKSANELLLFYQLAFQKKQIDVLYEQIKDYAKLNVKLTNQRKLTSKEAYIIQKKFHIDSTLLSQKAISSIELDQSEILFLQKKRELENVDISIINNTIQIASLQAKIHEVEIEKKRQEKQLVVTLENAVKNFRSSLKSWKEKYLIQSSSNGRVAFLKSWNNNQYINSNEDILSIIPYSNDLIGKAETPLLGSGKIKQGQRVNIRLENYPYDQFGIVEGMVKTISEIPSNNNTYTIDISLPYGLKTSYKKELEFKQQMHGSTEIITEDLRLIQRVFYQFRTLWKKYGSSDKTKKD